MKPAFSYARLKKGDAYRKHTQRECDKVLHCIYQSCKFNNYQEAARIEIGSSEDSGDSDDDDNLDDSIKTKTSNNSNKRKMNGKKKFRNLKKTSRTNRSS